LFSSWEASDWQPLLVFNAICLIVFLICGFGGHLLPIVDIISATWTLVVTVVTQVAISVAAKAGRHGLDLRLRRFLLFRVFCAV
jgi:hypothetical protein